MTSLESCCVCLNNFLGLYKLCRTDEDNISLLSKLTITIPQIEWQETYQICEPCKNLLDIVYTFRETCIKSDKIRKKQLYEDEPIIKPETVQSEQEDECDDDYNPDYSDFDNKDIVKNELEDDGPTPPKRKRKLANFKCEICQGDCFISSRLLIRHCVQVHGMDSKSVRPFACTICNSRFGNSSNLLQHVKYHKAERSNICTYCGKGFITKTDLKIHEKQHLNMREYKCDTCSKCFNTHKDLRSHKLVVHTDPKSWKYYCDMCNKPFPIKSNYDCHMRRHTGDKKFECHLCVKKFTDKCVLQRHMRTHSNVREFKCEHCEKEYKDKRVMQIHMAKIHGVGVGDIKLPSKERKYICHICPKAYYAKNKLTRHLYTHSGEKPFICTICDKKFNDKSYVKQHMRKTHNIEEHSGSRNDGQNIYSMR